MFSGAPSQVSFGTSPAQEILQKEELGSGLSSRWGVLHIGFHNFFPHYLTLLGLAAPNMILFSRVFLHIARPHLSLRCPCYCFFAHNKALHVAEESFILFFCTLQGLTWLCCFHDLHGWIIYWNAATGTETWNYNLNQRTPVLPIPMAASHGC